MTLVCLVKGYCHRTHQSGSSLQTNLYAFYVHSNKVSGSSVMSKEWLMARSRKKQFATKFSWHNWYWNAYHLPSSLLRLITQGNRSSGAKQNQSRKQQRRWLKTTDPHLLKRRALQNLLHSALKMIIFWVSQKRKNLASHHSTSDNKAVSNLRNSDKLWQSSIIWHPWMKEKEDWVQQLC